MKRFLLFCVALYGYQVVCAQTHTLNATPIAAGTYSDPANHTETQVVGSVRRTEKVMYRHTTSTFMVQSGWLTPFAASLPATPGTDTTNSDYFLAPGENRIQGSFGESVIIFDTVYFNNGANSKMTIESYNSGNSPSLNFGQCPGSIIVTRRLEFNNGITSTSRTYPVNGAIVFSNNAAYTGGNDNVQHVDGFVSEVNYAANLTPMGHGGDFTFPVGNGSENYPLRRQGDFTSTDHTLTVGWVSGDPHVTPDPTININTQSSIHETGPGFLQPGIAAVSRLGFWDWHYQYMGDPNLAPDKLTSAQTITVDIPNLSGLPISASELRLVGWNAQEGWWVNLSGSTGATGLAKGSKLSGTIPANTVISALAIGSTNVALPVTFGTFKVTASGCKALINWQTSFEQNNNYFKVERSANGRDFSPIAQVASSGNSTTLRNYQFTDLTPFEGVNYYRITQVDFDGKQASTDVNAIRIQCNGTPVSLKLFPNPAKQQVNVLTGKAVSQVNVLNSGGQPVLRYTPSVNQGGTFSVNISSIASGVYLLQVVNRDGTKDIIKFVKD